MRRFTLSFFALLLSAFAVKAQTVATFETLTLPKADTAYVNYSSFGNDVGFADGLAYFPCVYDTFPGSPDYPFWNYGFAYSNQTDSLTPGYMNQYSAITGKGYENSVNYVVAYGQYLDVRLTGKAVGQPVNGFYVTNNAYAYYSMKNGDAFAKKFGGVSGNDSDWYKITIRGYRGDTLAKDSVEVFLADFRSANNNQDTILKGWKWVNLLPLGNVDSLNFQLSSSDTGMFGMNTPAYFCMDNFSTYETSSVDNVPVAIAAKVYPNPAVNTLFIEAADEKLKQVTVLNATGVVMASYKVTAETTIVDVAAWPAGVYILQLTGEGRVGSMRFVKQ